MILLHNALLRSIILFLILCTCLFADNKYPIIFVHGFMGWGPDEMAGYKYWGGKNDITNYLKEQGFEVYTASVGPVSSNWDRAVELFYQIKGGQVDYGQDHAKTYGLIQKPEAKNFPGLYPDWDQNHPIHIIGHSMGGQTARMLQYLLESVFYLEEEKEQPEESTLLGYVHTGWITSITTISTPHNGTTLSDIITKGIPFLQDVMGVAAVVGNDFFDFDLQQWGFEKRREETWVAYFRRMREHKAWGTRNVCAWDVSLEGARSLNTLAPVSSNIYYFSYATSNTKLDSASGFHVPHKSMNLILRANARIMGRKKAYWTDGTATDSTWYENDGIVNTISQLGPTTGTDGEDHIVAYKAGELLIPGQWYHIKTYNLDHKAFIGHGLKGDEKISEMLALFKDQCNLLQSLPAKE